MNKRLLESKMKLFGDTQASLGKAIGVSTSRLSAKINKYEGAEFTQGEINAIKERYNLSADEVNLIFFTLQVS
jgi:hypothetical protein